MANKTILIVDDDADLREILSAKLSKAGFTIEQAVNGKEGLAQIQAHAPDLVLLDVDMPEMNGVEMFRQLKSDPELRKVNVVFLTNFDEPRLNFPARSEEEQKELSAVGYIRKSSDLDVLAAYVEGMIQ